jgi:hypothetical protein
MSIIIIVDVNSTNIILSLFSFLLHVDCAACPTGYISVNCTTHSDRVCEKCTVCGDGYYTATSCSIYKDTSCACTLPPPFFETLMHIVVVNVT